jgi:anti-sigma regulatory factor (Ser/Thr protein kinase)
VSSPANALIIDAAVDPYRTLAVDSVPEAPRDPGIVGDVIRQFADSKAFLRELVQNSIDAGSPSVEVRIEHDVSAQKLRVTVRDRGVGMSRDTLENQLLVLFRSTKETDATKIGKFGIGFASVLAPAPEVVIVQSVHGGRRLTLHLYRDLTYELFDGGTATQAGTSVELVLAIEEDGVEPFVRASVEALVRWCRHANVPIELTWVSPVGPAQTTRIDRPLALENAIVQVVDRSADGHLIAVVGVLPDLSPYTGFFNHGLMLYESAEPVVGRVAAKIQDSRLGHTLSRDNVRRDEAYDRAVSFARALATKQLPRAIEADLRAAADAGDLARYRLLANAAIRSNTTVDWRFPLADPVGDTRSIAGADLPRRAWTSEGGSRLSALVTATKRPVLDAVVGEIEGLPSLIHAVYGCQLTRLEGELTAVTPVTAKRADVALLEMLREMFGAAGKVPSAIVLATLEGSRGDALVIAGERTEDDEAYVLDRTATYHSPFARLRRPPLVVSIDHPLYKRARAGDPRLAASHLARAILLEYRLLDVETSQRLLEHTLDALG